MMAGNQPAATGIQRAAESLYNNPDDDFQHVAGTTPATETPFSRNRTFVDRVAAYADSASRESVASEQEADAPYARESDEEPAVPSFPIPHEHSCARHATTESVRNTTIESAAGHAPHPQHVHTSPAQDPQREPSAQAGPADLSRLPEFVPVVTGFPANPVNQQQQQIDRQQESLLHQEIQSQQGIRTPHPRETSTHARANTVVEDQLNYISQGPFPEELKQALITEVLSFATQGAKGRPHTMGESDAARQLQDAQQAEDERFVNQMEQALKISEDTPQPNDPSVHDLVGCVHNFTVLAELQRGNEEMYNKLCMLAPYIHQYRPVIGDGNCFYRCFAFGLVESHLWNREQLMGLKATIKQLATAAITWLSSKQAMQLLRQDYTAYTRRSRVLMESGYKKFSDMIKQCLTLLDANHDPWPTLLTIFQDNDGEDIMHLIRQLAAFEMLSKHKQYETFLPAIEGLRRSPMLREDEEITVPLVVSRLVVVNGMEAEHVMIQALSTLTQVSIGVVYCDGEALPQVHVIQPSHKQDGSKKHGPRLFVIFRSGHYDLVYPDTESWIQLQARTRPDRG